MQVRRHLLRSCRQRTPGTQQTRQDHREANDSPLTQTREWTFASHTLKGAEHSTLSSETPNRDHPGQMWRNMWGSVLQRKKHRAVKSPGSCSSPAKHGANATPGRLGKEPEPTPETPVWPHMVPHSKIGGPGPSSGKENVAETLTEYYSAIMKDEISFAK